MPTLLQDLRYGARTLRNYPSFTLIAVITLALGIGANTVIFNFINAALLKPMPVRDPERLVAVYPTTKEGELIGFSFPDYVDYRDRNDVFSALVGFGGLMLSISDPGNKTQPQLIWGEDVTGNYFSGLGIEMFAGRGFLPEENKTPGAHPVAVVSFKLWQNHFAADPQLVGKTVKLNNLDFTVIGIAPRGFSGVRFAGYIPDVWFPLMMKQQLTRDSFDHVNYRQSHFLMLWGRLKPGITKEQAQAVMNVITRQLECAQTRHHPGVLALPDRNRDRTGRRLFFDARDAKPALRRERYRPDRLCRTSGITGAGSARRLLDSGAAGNESRPDNHASMRIVKI
jgi:MacB-like periplasmic core domain